ncbi:MAG: excinuclease ABC subunit UvrB [Patescibacteria group bacterium]
MKFDLQSSFKPTGDQPQAIEKLVEWVKAGNSHQTLLGVTGSGKTFTMANVIQKVQKPTLIVSHNKTLAAQLYQEFRDFFPENAVSYFVSYYDYYQPEAYIPTTDTYIEKDATINDEIDKLRLASTTNLLTRPDCIVVASVSCIYNLGSPVEYGKYVLELIEGEVISRETLMLQLINLQYERSDMELRRGTFRVKGEMIQIWPAYEDKALRVVATGATIDSINWIDPLTGKVLPDPKKLDSELLPSPENHYLSSTKHDNEARRFVIYPAKHYQTNPDTQAESIKQIEADLQIRLKDLRDNGKIVEAYRLEQKVTYDMDMVRELGFVNGIENYSRYFDGRQPGDPPFTLLDYMQHNANNFGDGSYLTIVDESHMSLPQVRGMFAGDRSRKETLIKYGFRLPSALDNRPLQFPEFLERSNQFVYVSATPEKWELEQSKENIAEQLIRPTGLIDPDIEIRPSEGQIPNVLKEILIRKAKGQRVLITTLTKKMSEVLTDYLNDKKNIIKLLEDLQDEELRPLLGQELKVAYLHSDVETLDRSDILDDLRRGEYDVLVGINLLREGLDLPEVTLVAILDADKAGFLRSKTALIQTMGRAARHNEGHVILYADQMSVAMKAAIEEVNRRRTVQMQYNTDHGITAETILKPIRDQLVTRVKEDEPKYKSLSDALNRESQNLKKGEKKPVLIQLTKNEIVDLNEINGESLLPADRDKMIKQLNKVMRTAANDMDFELAALVRDRIKSLEE